MKLGIKTYHHLIKFSSPFSSCFSASFHTAIFQNKFFKKPFNKNYKNKPHGLSFFPTIRPHLVVNELNENQWKTAVKIISLWNSSIKDLANQNAQTQNIFKDSHFITTLILSEIDSYFYSKMPMRIFVSRQENSEVIEAIALTSNPDPSELAVKYLATNPKNLKSPLRPLEYTFISGAGSSIITHLKKICESEKRDRIVLTSVNSAIPFYKKLGFQTESGKSSTLFLKI